MRPKQMRKKTFNVDKFLHIMFKRLKNIYWILKVIKDIFGLFQK